jgi:GYF domain 2
MLVDCHSVLLEFGERVAQLKNRYIPFASLLAAGLFCIAMPSVIWAQSAPPDAPVAVTADTYYVSVAGDAKGPFPVADIKKRMAAGEIKPDAYVVKTGASDWKRATEVSAFQAPSTPEEIATYLIGSWTSKPVVKDADTTTLFLLFGRSGMSVATLRTQKAGAEPDNKSDVGPFSGTAGADGAINLVLTIDTINQQSLVWQDGRRFTITIKAGTFEMIKD